MKKVQVLERTLFSATLWLPAGECRMALQVVHGMTEHMGRYEQLVERLTATGIAVAGFDLPGHGHHPGNPQVASMGEQGWERALEQIAAVNRELHDQFPGRPVALLGFSLGSFLVRDYLRTHCEEVSAAVILGSGDQPSFVLSALKSLIKGQIRKVGFDQTSPLVRKLSFETYNQKFKPNRTPADWLCSDPQELDAYLADPLSRQDISAGLFWQLLDGMQRTGKDPYETWNRNLPVLLLSGTDDPVGDMGKGMQRVAQKMKAHGMTNVKLELIPHARHDLLHEVKSGAAKSTLEILLSWL